MKIAFIGGGVMGEAMISGILSRRLTTPDAIIISDADTARCSYLIEKHGVMSAESNRLAMEKSEIVVLSIKPQALTKVMKEIAGQLKPEQLVLSIVAGASIDTITEGLEHNSVVRVMPNICAQIGEGISVWTTANGVSQSQKEVIRSILGALGKETYVIDEKYLDMATAVSGSGPAYIFLIIESLIDAAVHIGFPRDLAGELVLQTVLGAAHLAQTTGKHPAELRNMVTSPGGTTAEGLLQLEEGGLRALLAQAIIAAYDRIEALRR